MDLFEWQATACDHLPVWDRVFVDDWLVCHKCNKQLRPKAYVEDPEADPVAVPSPPVAEPAPVDDPDPAPAASLKAFAEELTRVEQAARGAGNGQCRRCAGPTVQRQGRDYCGYCGFQSGER